jgi:hypothetical protein
MDQKKAKRLAPGICTTTLGINVDYSRAKALDWEPESYNISPFSTSPKKSWIPVLSFPIVVSGCRRFSKLLSQIFSHKWRVKNVDEQNTRVWYLGCCIIPFSPPSLTTNFRHFISSILRNIHAFTPSSTHVQATSSLLLSLFSATATREASSAFQEQVCSVGLSTAVMLTVDLNFLLMRILRNVSSNSSANHCQATRMCNFCHFSSKGDKTKDSKKLFLMQNLWTSHKALSGCLFWYEVFLVTSRGPSVLR